MADDLVVNNNLVADGSPTKEFFVGMLTRDIELEDAILDLLDNCLDGVVRSKRIKDKLHDSRYYEGFHAEIIVTRDKFIIQDNCGGIPQETAIKYAFRMGRDKNIQENVKDDPLLPTVGIYGIGMKRAIFKIGKRANVFTRHNGKKYTVKIPADWATIESWDFPIINDDVTNPLTENGTLIEITDINDGIKERWEDSKNFCNHLYQAIQNSYSFIIQKGFKITINGTPIDALPIELLIETTHGGDSIKPYVFTNTYADVDVKIAIGFYAPTPSDDELDEMNETKRTSNDAGITIVCNDRVVLYNDKSALTGWGTAKVPNYHTQFIGIKGIVIFESTNPKSLPMTTTKRGIDHSSPIYLVVKDRICDGLKMFTNYTNKWKGQKQAERLHSTKAEKVPLSMIFNEERNKSLGITLRHTSRGNIFNPQLPSPVSDKPYKMIRYSKNSEDVQIVSQYLFRESDCEPSKVGEKCFDLILLQAKDKK